MASHGEERRGRCFQEIKKRDRGVKSFYLVFLDIITFIHSLPGWIAQSRPAVSIFARQGNSAYLCNVRHNLHEILPHGHRIAPVFRVFPDSER